MRKFSKVPYFLVMTVWIVVSAASVRGAKSAPQSGDGGTNPTAGYHKIWESRLPVSGDVISGPAMQWKSADTYRFQVIGVLDTGKLGAKYDAEFKNISAREFRVRHEHFRFGSPSWVTVYAHHQNHRYVYRQDPNAGKRPRQVRVSLEGIASRFRISPARLKRESKSTMVVSLWKKGPDPKGRGATAWQYAGLFAGLALLLGLIVWWIRRR